MNVKQRLNDLLELPDIPQKKWARGYIPEHYKRITIDKKEQMRLALIGLKAIWEEFGEVAYYTQAIIAGAILSGDFDRLTIVSGYQYGKLIEDDCDVLTRHGWKKHGDLQIGDEVISPEGKFVKVIGVSPKGDANRLVTFQNGEKVKCHARHEWTVYNAQRKKFQTLETDEIMFELGKKHMKQQILLPKVRIEGYKKNLPDPYTFGVWLGDGSTTKGQICSAPKDIAVLDKCREAYPKGKDWVHKVTGVITRSFIGFANDVSKYNLCSQKSCVSKYIPQDFLTASEEQRLQLLAGLIDTDGYKDKNDRYVFTTAEPNLRDTFCQLLATFGIRYSVVSIPPRLSSSGIQGKKEYYVIGFNPNVYIPCVLERKRSPRVSKQRRVSIASVEPCESVQGNCITVEGGHYCVTKQLIPTHNSFITGHTSLLMAYKGQNVAVAAPTTPLTEMVMGYVFSAIRESTEELKLALINDSRRKVDKIGTSLSRQKITFKDGGSVEALTLGDTYDDVSHNRAVGKGTAFIIDEAAMVSDKAYMETTRREFSSTDGSKNILVAISNPHQPGWFYDALTGEADDRHLIIWMDVLTGIQEGKWTKEQVRTSEPYVKNDIGTIIKYFLCELPESGAGMFEDPKICDDEILGVNYIGVDAAYKGKDSICYARAVFHSGKVHIAEVVRLKKKRWIQGKTSYDIIKQTARVARGCGAPLTCVDVGQGIWLTEGLDREGIQVQGIHFGAGPTPKRVEKRHYAATNAANLRAEMHLDLQQLIEAEQITFSSQAWQSVKAAFPFVVAELKSNGKYKIRDKEIIKQMIGHSPDELDAILLAIHAGILDMNRPAYITEGR